MNHFVRKEIKAKKICEKAHFKVSLVEIQKNKYLIASEAIGNPPQGNIIEMQSSYKEGEAWKHTVWVREDMHENFLKAYLDMVQAASWQLPNHELITQLVNAEKDSEGGSSVIIITDKNKKDIIEKLLLLGYSEDFWASLSESDPDLADKIVAGQLVLQRKKVIDNLKQRLTQSYPETDGSDSWQNWIYANNWLFGANYKKPIEKQKININGIMPDYLFPTLDNFVDILEIKLPSFEVLEEDKSHRGSWAWSRNSNIAIGQVANYLCEIDRQVLEIEKQIKKSYGIEVSLLKPRAFILIGNSSTWKVEKKEGLRRLNHTLHGIEILTYAELIRRGESFVSVPSDHL
ncbi:MAG: Shedu anti-phage system protein SduA domain-containing protein [Candidatus Peribacteraceae bacterium]|jgi:hypothetical protein